MGSCEYIRGDCVSVTFGTGNVDSPENCIKQTTGRYSNSFINVLKFLKGLGNFYKEVSQSFSSLPV